MALVRWEPARSRQLAQGDPFRLFTSLFDSSTVAPSVPARRFTPATDLVEREDAYVLTADLPGLAEGDVHIEVTDGILTVAGERKDEHQERTHGYYRIERTFGSFRRTLRLPEGVEPQAITATFDKGVLTVTVPKPAQQQPQTIQITATAPAPSAAAQAEAEAEAEAPAEA